MQVREPLRNDGILGNHHDGEQAYLPSQERYDSVGPPGNDMFDDGNRVFQKFLSIVIATFNRCGVLALCLTALTRQKGKVKFEVIIVDDGGSDDTRKVCESFGDKLQIKYFYQENQGQGIARNLGISESSGEIIVFINDDIIVSENFLVEHLLIHEKHLEGKVAVLGFIDWDPQIKITPFMKWLTNGSCVLGKFGGHQFAFEKLAQKNEADYNFFYTSNISLKKSLLRKEHFCTEFKAYGWEDIELGYRLDKKHGLVLRYNHKAIGYHHHEITVESFGKRMEMIGASVRIFDSMHSELKKSPAMLKRIIFRFLGSIPVLAILKFFMKSDGGYAFDLYHYALSKKYFLKGFYNKK